MSQEQDKEQGEQAPKGSKPWWGFVVTLLAGIGLSAYLSWVHMVVKFAGDEVGGLCNLSAKINCNVAAGSIFSQVGGIPISILGLAFYVGALVLLMFHGRKTERYVPHVLQGLFSLACLYSLFLAGVSAFFLGSLCWACTGLYVVNIVGLVLSRVLAGQGYGKTYKELFKNLWGIAPSTGVFSFMVVTILSVGVGWWASDTIGAQLEMSPGERTAEGQAWLKTDYLTVDPLSGEDRKSLEEGSSKGPDDAPVVLVEFSDFECPFCSKVVPSVDKLLKEYEGKIKVVFRQNPLDMACNPRLNKKFHQHACAAAEAALCAQEQGKFWPMHDQLFANQRALKADDLVAHAKAIGLDVNEFKACVASDRADKAIKWDITNAKRFGVRGTPTLFLNGRKLRGAVPYHKLKAAVEYELEQAAGGATN